MTLLSFFTLIKLSAPEWTGSLKSLGSDVKSCPAGTQAAPSSRGDTEARGGNLTRNSCSRKKQRARHPDSPEKKREKGPSEAILGQNPQLLSVPAASLPLASSAAPQGAGFVSECIPRRWQSRARINCRVSPNLLATSSSALRLHRCWFVWRTRLTAKYKKG